MFCCLSFNKSFSNVDNSSELFSESLLYSVHFFLFPSAAAHIPAAGLKLGHISCILSFLCPRSLLLGTVIDEGEQTSRFFIYKCIFFCRFVTLLKNIFHSFKRIGCKCAVWIIVNLGQRHELPKYFVLHLFWCYSSDDASGLIDCKFHTTYDSLFNCRASELASSRVVFEHNIVTLLRHFVTPFDSIIFARCCIGINIFA